MRDEYRQQTIETIKELDSENPNTELIQDYVTEIAILGNATDPKYTEDMLTYLQEGEELKALNLATHIENNITEIYREARENTADNKRQERVENAVKAFEIPQTPDSNPEDPSNPGGGTIKATT